MILPPLTRGKLIKRYKRFLMDATLESGEMVTAHSVNTGSMHGVLDEGNGVWMSRSDNPARKLAYTWELVEAQGTLMGINTSFANKLAVEAIRNGAIPELAGYETLRTEVKYGTNSRIDILLESAGKPPCYVEVKNAHMKRGTRAEFPDAVTARGAKHMEELGILAAQGIRAVVLFVVQRDDCDGFSLAADIDPAYADAVKRALTKGVEAMAYCCYVAPDEIRIHRKLPIFWA
ncbi:MAG: DNA/RNA nuclease SfsA [Alphaproteobacteria bacterium]|nr:DNA/RNA nuclease SfsA [Alphaproteobacteria bacterium]